VVLWYKKQYHDKQLFSPDTIQLQDLLDYHSYPSQISDVMLIAKGLCTLCIQLGSLHMISVAMKTTNDMAKQSFPATLLWIQPYFVIHNSMCQACN
jgi:hypothetical protein